MITKACKSTQHAKSYGFLFVYIVWATRCKMHVTVNVKVLCTLYLTRRQDNEPQNSQLLTAEYFIL